MQLPMFTLRKQHRAIDVASKLLSKESLTARELTFFLGISEIVLQTNEFGRLYLGHKYSEKNQRLEYGNGD